jgi:hypothetical protein
MGKATVELFCPVRIRNHSWGRRVSTKPNTNAFSTSFADLEQELGDTKPMLQRKVSEFVVMFGDFHFRTARGALLNTSK